MIRFCLEWNAFTDVFQQRRNDEAEQFAAGQQKRKKRPREPKSRSSSEEMQSMSPWLSKQEGGDPISRAQPCQGKFAVMALRVDR